MPFNLFMIFVNVPFSPKKKKNCDESFFLWKKKIIFTTSSKHTHTQKILVWEITATSWIQNSPHNLKKKKKVTTKAPHNLQSTAKDKRIKKNVKKK